MELEDLLIWGGALVIVGGLAYLYISKNGLPVITPGTGGGTTGGGAGAPPPTAGTTYTFDYKFGTKGNGDGQFQDPHDVSFDKADNVFVTDRVRNDIQVFTHAGKFIRKFGGSGSAPGKFNVPYSVQLDSADNIYVADRGNNRIQKLTHEGVPISQITSGGGKAFKAPEDVIFAANGDMFICDTGNERVVKFDKNHTFLLQWGSKGKADGQFDHPHSSAIGPDGNVYINSGNQGYIQVFNTSGKFLRKFGTPGKGEGQLLVFLEHMDIDKFGRLHIVNNDARPIVSVFDALTGKYLTKYGTGTKGSANGQFNEAEHVTIDSAGKPFVVDAMNQRIQVFKVD